MRATWAFALLLGLLGPGCGGQGLSPTTEVALPQGAALLPARARRLTNLELERSVEALTGVEFDVARDLPPEVRQEGYTPNANQDVSASWAAQYGSLAAQAAERAARERRQLLAPCADFALETCRASTVQRLGLRAFRRPLEAAEQHGLEALLLEGEAGLSLLLRALLEAPSFLYLSELGGKGQPGQRVRLDDYEIASQLSYTLRGGPPDQELLSAATSGQLRGAVGRLRQAERLLSLADTRHQFRRFALEWLEVDGLLQTAKSSQRFPNYDVLKPFMLAETESYVDEVMVNGGASVQALLAGGFASVGPEMARFYGLSSYGPRASLGGTGRLGVLQQASFLAAHAHEDVTSPVKRGDFVMRKLLCEKVKRPGEIGLEVVMPPPAPNLTNRQRLSQHIADPSCAGCHTTLDAIGYTFESFDAMGARQTSDRGHAIDASAKVQLGRGSAVRELHSSAALTQALLENPTISECFARHAFRYFSAQSDPRIEASFLALREQLPPAERDNLLSVLLAYVGSDLFVLREVRGR